MAISQRTILPLEHDSFAITYHRFKSGSCISVSRGDLQKGVPIVRFHSSCLFGESFRALDCDCAQQLNATLKLIASDGRGVVVYEYAEGRGIGLEKKICALEIQRRKKVDTVDAFKTMGLEPDSRSYDIAVMALNDLKVAHEIKFVTQNPNKLVAVKNAGFEVAEVINPEVVITNHNKSELLTKKHRLGYSIDNI